MNRVARAGPRHAGRTGSAAKVLLVLVAAVVLAVLYGARGRDSKGDSAALVGQWQSSRTNTPIHILANGEWEIRREGKVLEYGVWRLERGNLIWTYKDRSGFRDDINPVLSTGRDQFQIRETDGSVTTFARVGDIR